MKSNEILYSTGKNDECYTPAYAVDPILKYVDNLSLQKHRKLIVWCPFDTSDSWYVKRLKTLKNVRVRYSHISEGKDFFTYEPKVWDVIVSNPPFTGTKQIFDRALSFGKPFALLSNLARFNDKNPMWCFYEAGVDPQLLKFDKRIEFIQPNAKGTGKIPFQTGYICRDFLPKQIVLEKLERS